MGNTLKVEPDRRQHCVAEILIVSGGGLPRGRGRAA